MEENRPEENKTDEADEAWLKQVYAAVQGDEEKLARVQWTDMTGQPLTEPEKRGEYILYSHICIPNGKTYVGITRQTPEQRWRNGSAYRSNPEFYADIQKYGWENFIHRIEYSGMTKEEAEIAESVFIGIAASAGTGLGYNRSEYGTSTWEPTEEQRKQMAEKRRAILPRIRNIWRSCTKPAAACRSQRRQGKRSARRARGRPCRRRSGGNCPDPSDAWKRGSATSTPGRRQRKQA